MPNWCANILTITGPKDVMEQFKSTIESNDDGLLEAVAPIGEWDYGVAVNTWGTKWDVSTEGLNYTELEDGTVEIDGQFDSAWGPPIQAFATLSEKHPELDIRLSYFEPGMAFVGEWTPDSGEESYHYLDEDVPEHLDEEWGIEGEIEAAKEWEEDEDF